MANEEAGDSELVDPLSSYSGISLLSTAFSIFPDSSRSDDPGTEIDNIHKHLKSMVSRSPSKLLEQAKAILDGNSNLMQSEVATSNVTEKKEDTAAKVEENPQERRPALNRKRARFSLKPDAGQPTVNLEPAMDIKQLKDPEEFFLAYERLENAKREIQKQVGGVLKDLNQQDPSMNTRQRRPGILGRSVRYKHQYSSIISDIDENAVLSQASFESDNVSPAIRGSENRLSSPIIGTENETAEDTVFEEELVASVTKTENKVNKILDELLSANCEDLEGDQAINILQERLQIKPINLEKLCLPDLQGIQTINLKSSRAKLPKRSVTGDNLLQRIETMKLKQDNESSVRLLHTPASLKSPLASLSSLKMHILQSNSSSDPFSAHDIDQSPIRNHSLFEHGNDWSDIVDIGKQSSVSELKSLVNEDSEIVTNNTSSPKVLVGDVDPLSEISSSDVLNIPQVGTDATSSEIDIHIESDNIGEGSRQAKINEKVGSFGAQALTNALDDKTEEHGGLASEKPDTHMVEAVQEHMNHTQRQSDQSTTTSGENIVDGLSRNDDGTGQHNKVVAKSRANKRPRPDQNKSRRQSLAAAGSKWEAGVRRSTRIRTRPLEYWKGERLLYGRVHESLATVIGLKYVSPAKGNGQPTLKVKSYVSDKYKELVELAALH